MTFAEPLAAQSIDLDNSMALRISRTLSERIVTGLLSPGERLMQDHIAKEFQASHVPVREAFRKLEAQGLVVSKPRCGVRVSDLDPAMVGEVTEMRAAMEGVALSHALPRLREAGVDVDRQALVCGQGSERYR